MSNDDLGGPEGAAARLDAIAGLTEVLIGMRNQLTGGGFSEETAEEMVKLFAGKMADQMEQGGSKPNRAARRR